MGFSRQEYWRGLPFPSPGDLPDPGIEPRSPALQADALTSEPPGKPKSNFTNCRMWLGGIWGDQLCQTSHSTDGKTEALRCSLLPKFTLGQIILCTISHSYHCRLVGRIWYGSHWKRRDCGSIIDCGVFPGAPLARTWPRQTLMGELRSHMPRGQKNKQKINIKENEWKTNSEMQKSQQIQVRREK